VSWASNDCREEYIQRDDEGERTILRYVFIVDITIVTIPDVAFFPPPMLNV
jgi:hypothetical protein